MKYWGSFASSNHLYWLLRIVFLVYHGKEMLRRKGKFDKFQVFTTVGKIVDYAKTSQTFLSSEEGEGR